MSRPARGAEVWQIMQATGCQVTEAARAVQLCEAQAAQMGTTFEVLFPKATGGISSLVEFAEAVGVKVRKDPRFNEACQRLADHMGLPFEAVKEMAWGGVAGITQAGVIAKLGMPLSGMTVEQRLKDFVAQVDKVAGMFS